MTVKYAPSCKTFDFMKMGVYQPELEGNSNLFFGENPVRLPVRSGYRSGKECCKKYSYKYQIKLFHTPPLHIQTMLVAVNMLKMPLKCLKIVENSRKSLKLAQKTRFYPKVVLQKFQNHCRYGSNIFGGSKHNL